MDEVEGFEVGLVYRDRGKQPCLLWLAIEPGLLLSFDNRKPLLRRDTRNPRTYDTLKPLPTEELAEAWGILVETIDRVVDRLMGPKPSLGPAKKKFRPPKHDSPKGRTVTPEQIGRGLRAQHRIRLPKPGR